MLVVIFSWEYPPRVVGQLAEHVKTLAVELVKNKVKTYVVTYHDYLTGGHDDKDGTRTVRVSNPVRTHIGVLTWVLTLNQEVERAAANIYYAEGRNIDLIDAHDWHFIPAAVTLKKALSIPFIYSVESLEEHRSHGANYPFNMAIKSIEWLGMYEASQLIVKSEWMRDEVIRVYKVPSEKIRVIPPKTSQWIKNSLEVYQKASGGAVVG
ncbi:MAG: glycosyltransferase family 4 protein [Candidatus Bathyarchaeota archaeon]|jgi:glycosyltransferase involved in cell wall biosynthesis|nr:glycosyltransferase family 4 protein [Candidatus Bathyarchaeota archaeon]